MLMSTSPQKYAQTCRFARRLVYEPKDHFLWRELYLGRPFDDLRKTAPVPRPRRDVYAAPVSANSDDNTTTTTAAGVSPPWRSELQRRIEAEAVANSSKTPTVQELLRAFETFLAAVDTARPISEGDIGEDAKKIAPRSKNLHWLDRVLRTKILNIPIPSFAPHGDSSTSASSSSRSSPPTEPLGPPSPVPRKRELRPTRARVQATPSPSTEDMLTIAATQLRSRLNTYLALSHDSSHEATGIVRMAGLRKTSRCFVYDMRRYQPATLWGPYRVVYPTATTDEVEPVVGKDAEGDAEGDSDSDADVESERGVLVVNWEHIEHILNVVGLKLREVAHTCLGFYKKPLFKLEALRAYSAVDALESAGREPHDWAGVTGKWRRFVCFMDYR